MESLVAVTDRDHVIFVLCERKETQTNTNTHKHNKYSNSAVVTYFGGIMICLKAHGACFVERFADMPLLAVGLLARND